MVKIFPFIFIILWSSAFVTTKPIIDNSDPFAALAFRFFVVAFGFFIFSIYARGVFYVLPWSWIYISIIWDSFVWFIVSLVLAQFVRPKHLGSS